MLLPKKPANMIPEPLFEEIEVGIQAKLNDIGYQGWNTTDKNDIIGILKDIKNAGGWSIHNIIKNHLSREIKFKEDEIDNKHNFLN